MNRIAGVLLTGAVLFALAAGQAARAGAEDARQIMQRSIDSMKLSNLESISTLVIKDNKGNQRVRKFTSATKEYSKEGVKKTIMRFLEPADVKGTGFLTFEYDQADKDNDMWLYLPALRKTRRIVSSEKAKSFMGSEFSNSDITAPKLGDYAYALVAEEKIGDADCWKIEAKPSTPEVADEYGYSRKVSWISKGDYMARRTEFYDREGTLHKVLTAQKIKLLDQAKALYQATDITMENVQNGRQSQFLINQSALNPKLKDDLFSTTYLAR